MDTGRRDGCTHAGCTAGTCQFLDVAFGDVNGSGGSADLDDILCALDGFAAIGLCPNADIDPDCTGDGDVTIDDVLAVLNAFAHDGLCGCRP
jgi:hypothetical protein